VKHNLEKEPVKFPGAIYLYFVGVSFLSLPECFAFVGTHEDETRANAGILFLFKFLKREEEICVAKMAKKGRERKRVSGKN
jgi:hypothetical protein